MADLGYLKQNVFPGESGGDYNALFGYSNRQGPFADIRPTEMTVNEVLQFTDPRGPYAQWVKGQIGRVATPVGAFQVVGSTLRDAVKGLGLTGNERFDQSTQDAVGMWIYQNQGPAAWSGWAKSGGNNLTMSTSGDKTMGLLDMQDEPQTFGQRLTSGMKDGRVLDAIALAANSLRMRPDENINQMVGMRQQQRQDAQTANRTSQWLASIGRTDLAQALATGALDAKSAVALAMQPAKERSAVEVGGKLVDPQTGEVIYDSGVSPTTGTDDMREYDAAVAQGFKGTFIDYMTAMKTAGVAPTTGTDDMREYDAAVAQGFKGTFMDYLTTVKKAGAPTTTMPAGETAYDKTLGEWGAKSYTTLQDSAAAALDQIGNLSYMESLMADPNFRTGTGTEAIISMRKLVEAMGGNPAEVGSIEAFRGATAQAVLGQMGGSLGAGFSNADRSFVESMAANLDNSLQGNKLVINAQRKVAQRKVELARLADQYIAEKGRLDAGWPQYMRAYAEQNPLFGGAGADPLSYVTGGGN